ncbi:hypothetical protein [Microcoleus sp. herbarium14]|uniref:hypothetical protein n=1 Tax=Microcoleus sp. herbarium14 TaxID=3055439 RepID=UPI002FCF386F
MRDPDREKEELGNPINEPVQAYNLKEAKKKCQQLATEYERSLADVRSLRQSLVSLLLSVRENT